MCWIYERRADLDFFDAGQCNDVTRSNFGRLDLLQSFESEKHCNFSAPVAGPGLKRQGDVFAWGEQHDTVADVDLATFHASDRHASEVRRMVKCGDQHLEAALGVARRRRHAID